MVVCWRYPMTPSIRSPWRKILVTLLAKLANFIPDAGIWMNTQRPEWNDAVNALVGTGVSVVTLCYLHCFLKQAISLFQQFED